MWAFDLSSLLAGERLLCARSSGTSEQVPRPVLLQQQAAEVASLSWAHPWLAVADRSGAVVLVDCGTATAAGAAAVEGCGSAGAAAAAAAAGSSRGGSKRRQLKQQAPRAVRVLLAAGMGGVGAGAGVQCVSLAGTWAAAGLDCGAVVTWDGAKGLQQQAAAAATRQAKAARRLRNQERHAEQQQQRNGAGSVGGGTRRQRSGPTHTPAAAAAQLPGSEPRVEVQAARRSAVAVDRGEGGSSGLAPMVAENGAARQGSPQRAAAVPRQQGSSRTRVPPPPRPEALVPGAAAAAGGGSCRQQAWQVLRLARGAAPLGPALAEGTPSPSG